MSRDHRFFTHSDIFSANVQKKAPESDNNRRVFHHGLEPIGATRNVSVFGGNMINSYTGRDSTARYSEETNGNNFNDNIQTYHRPDMLSYRNQIDRSNTYDYSEYPTTNNFVHPNQPDIPKNYFRHDEHYKLEYKKNSNVSNFHHNFEKENFNNSSSGYNHNNLENYISRSRETKPPSPFATKQKLYTSTPLWSNPREGNSHKEQINSKKTLSDVRERPLRRSPFSFRAQMNPDLNYSLASFENRNNLNIKDERIETKNEFEVSPNNDKVISKNQKSKIRNDQEIELLVCPHCNLKYFNSIEYNLHLKSSTHLEVLRKVVSKLNAILIKTRKIQRRTQNELEKNFNNLKSSTNFCQICKLIYQQSEATHEASLYHKKIQDIVGRYCKICKIKLSGHVAYENHICSLKHLRKEACSDLNEIVVADKNISDDCTWNIIDEANGEPDEVVINEPQEKLVILGREKVCKVEVYYCELCKMYLPRINNDELESVISAHCNKQFHLRQYYTYLGSNNCSNQDEVLVKQEDLKKEEIVDDELNKCVDVGYCYNEELPDKKRPQLHEKTTEEYDETLDEFKNSENKCDVYKPYLRKEEFRIIEEIALKDENDDNNSEKLENFENKIHDELDKLNLQEDVIIDNQDDSNVQKSPLSVCLDVKQCGSIDINQDLIKIIEKLEYDTDEFTE